MNGHTITHGYIQLSKNTFEIGIGGDTNEWLKIQMNHDNSLRSLIVEKLNIL